jgi:non-lysosomal glucosylceramidase
VHPPMRVFAEPGEAGLFTCTWPKSTHLEENGVLYRNEVWTGIEYEVAGDMVWEGMLEEALSIVRGIHERYSPSKRNPYNEVECGDHYARAMASWGVFTALSGYEYHGPKGFLAFAPKMTPDEFRSAFTAAEGWGSFTQSRDGTSQTDRIEVRWGKLRLKMLAFEVGDDLKPREVTVKLDDKAIEASHAVVGRRVEITFPEEILVNEGESLTVVISP